jgi:hypothetical protein
LARNAHLTKGYWLPWEFEGVKKPAEAGSFVGTSCLTWPLGQPYWLRGHPPQQVHLVRLLGLPHLRRLPARVLGLPVLSPQLGQRLGQKVLLFGSWRCQSRRPAQ